jgi:tRNA (guanine-N7-)-methyltransferase
MSVNELREDPMRQEDRTNPGLADAGLARLLQGGDVPASHPDAGDGDEEGPTSYIIDPATGRRMPHYAIPHPKRRALNPYIDQLEALPDLIIPFVEAYGHRGRWQSRFPRPQPLYLELGSGTGHFLSELAARHPDRNFLGLELKYKRLYKAAEKVRRRGLTNLQYLRFDALYLDQAFAPGELAGVYINFPDPWPKDRQIDKRMVAPPLVAQLERILPPGGRVELKSDWEPYRALFPEAFAGSRFVQTDHVADLGAWHRAEANVPTSYERRFRHQGFPCFFYEFTLQG